MDRRIFSISLLTGALGLSACASEDGPPGGGRGERAREDAPEMLFISPAGEPFRAKPPAPYPVVDWFKQANKSGDGKLTLAEFLADAERFFHVLDINKDGVIDHREIYYYEHRTVPEMLGQSFGALVGVGAPARLWKAQFSPGSPGGAPVTHGGDGPALAPQNGGRLGDHDAPLIGAAAFSMLADPEPVQGCDIRLTGTITLADFKTRNEQRFQLLDDENKGYLTLAGLPETEAQKNAPRRHGGFQRGLRGRTTPPT